MNLGFESFCCWQSDIFPRWFVRVVAIIKFIFNHSRTVHLFSMFPKFHRNTIKFQMLYFRTSCSLFRDAIEVWECVWTVFEHHSPVNNSGKAGQGYTFAQLLILINFCSRISHSFDSTIKLKNTADSATCISHEDLLVLLEYIMFELFTSPTRLWGDPPEAREAYIFFCACIGVDDNTIFLGTLCCCYTTICQKTLTLWAEWCFTKAWNYDFQLVTCDAHDFFRWW